MDIFLFYLNFWRSHRGKIFIFWNNPDQEIEMIEDGVEHKKYGT